MVRVMRLWPCSVPGGCTEEDVTADSRDQEDLSEEGVLG